MPYVFSQAANPLAIAECEYASAAEIRFSTFTSCIGIVGIRNGEVFGIHLPLAVDDFVTNADIDAALVHCQGLAQTTITGVIGAWTSSRPTVYAYLVAQLGNPAIGVDHDEGVYGARVNNGNLVLSYP
ncbi:hypothetical protein AUP42_03200 [Thalassospira lucentensis]|uniref:Uncharacterized protein n=2 Tax=Thalassospira TaxID=168934 RepID=A0A367WZI9_9PROT|nr:MULTISPECIES: hypothetical protein [Thalassospira]UKV15823.1 hypothetical protein L6172_05805 [Thalassospiraceae bacterium SW-3-3]KZB55546.1 hypothetical protein AUP41_16995 [Thalassospira xiamenensis]KZB61988.1 hypothetical protein AUP42_03200 [Thalassospira lucentensis]MAZ32108.1 hypothetical protein [Thalassospira sp.]MBO9508160.1 hypothetical protein [Thalassospira sp. A3_1]|tara:strand:- start:50 stop:433 length:384 start_codon:yes stop_codon:yes gene_type:complete